MDFALSAEQEAMRDAVCAFLRNEAGPAHVRRMMEDERGVDDALWRRFAEMGWLGIVVPEAHGGLGLGLVDLAIVQEELGKLAFSAPYFSSAVCATLAAVRLDATDLLADLADGTRRGTLAFDERGAGDPLDRITTTATPTADGGWVLDGVKPLVADGHTADWAIIVAREPDGGVAGFVVEDPPAEAVPALDVTRKVARLNLAATAARRIGPAGDQRELWARIVDDCTVALCAETVGVCEGAQRMAVDYAQQRVQFDRPIASFQAIRHKLVDMLHKLELARVGTQYAAWASDVDDPARETAAAMCKGYVGEIANDVTGENIQVHGGVGFTWDVDCHLLFRRAKSNDLLLGSSGWQRQRLADLVLDASM
jgi:alkylation response protein AidB-like acyl-CoA dehydrogenase